MDITTAVIVLVSVFVGWGLRASVGNRDDT